MCGDDKNDLRPNFKGDVSTGLGATQILIGVFSIGFGIWGLLVYASYYYIFFGVWAGALFLIAGAVAVAAASKPVKSMITATMALCIISVIAGAAQVVFSVFSLLDATKASDFNNDCYISTSFNYTECGLLVNFTEEYYCSQWLGGYRCTLQQDVEVSKPISLALMVAGGLLIAIALANAIICCSCCMKTSKSKVMPLNTSSTHATGHNDRTPLVGLGLSRHSMAIQTDDDTLYSSRQPAPPYTQAAPPPPQVYILPMPGYNSGRKTPLQALPHPYPQAYPYPQAHPYPPVTHRDQAQHVEKSGAKRHEPQKRSEPAKPEQVTMESGPPNLDGDQVVRIGEKVIHIPQK